MPSLLQHKLRIISHAPNYLDFCDFLEALGNEASDIRQPINPDSIEIRQGISTYLKNTVDTIKRIRKNEVGTKETYTDD